MKSTNRTIYIAGDTIIDHHTYIKKGKDSTYPSLIRKSQKGGAHLLYDLLEIFKQKKVTSSEEKLILENFDIQFCHKENIRKIAEDDRTETGLLWEPFRLTNKKANPDYKKYHWRISKKLGYGHSINSDEKIKDFIFKDNIKPKKDDILIIDDGGLKFREQSDAFLKLLNNDLKHIILKMSNPVAQGSLFHELTSKYADKLIIITTASDLRKSNVKISKAVSWEQSITDLVQELEHNEQIWDLKKCKSLIVTFSTEGAFYFEKSKNGKEERIKYRLLFDNKYLEGEFIEEELSGEVFGYQSTFTTAILLGLIYKDFDFEKNKNAFETMINNGLSATRALAINGHGNIDKQIPEYPYEEVFKNLVTPNQIYAFAFVPQPAIVGASNFDKWSILTGNYKLETQATPLFDEAIRHILNKKKGLINAPHYSVNHFFTVDRKEIEGLRNIKQLIQSYDTDKEEKKPLSIAVFGSPGSGKSFVVKQLEKGIHIDNTSFLEFNLSQFSDPNDLIGALHQVRDEVLKGNLPFVFWDEFDSKEYMWLQYLLAPMQDGKFQEGQITHNIGRCIFIFAGGTSYDFKHFGHTEPDKPEFAKYNDYRIYDYDLAEYKEKHQKFENFKLKKGPDFKSRLSGYFNVMGPNQEYTYNEKTGKWDILTHSDVYYPIRRANLFNALSGFDASISEIDNNLLNVILKTSKYKHGARSCEKVIKSIFQDSHGKMLKSNLPPDALLDSHVDKKEFMKLINDSNEFEIIANKIAKNVHNNWMALGDKEGWKLEYHKEFDYLPSHIKRENIAAVLRIPGILKEAGFTITDNPFFDNSESFKDVISKNPELLEKLAILEHDGWVKFKKSNGWKKGKRNDDKKLHNCMVDFNKLSAKDQNKDKDAIRNIPVVLKNAELFIKKI
ncbi:MAG: hypothetical protein K8S16_07145 [Bacteroidales bacterium]|nr:hypothetical protein [Bacteroidales bacterium]